MYEIWDSWSEGMTDACAKEFVDSNFVSKHNFITLSQAGPDYTLRRDDIWGSSS